MVARDQNEEAGKNTDNPKRMGKGLPVPVAADDVHCHRCNHEDGCYHHQHTGNVADPFELHLVAPPVRSVSISHALCACAQRKSIAE
jgi:hypothetical protein